MMHHARIVSDIGVVVLNYCDWKSTVACVRSIIRCDPLPAQVVVVDNASPNESVAELSHEFAQHELVTVLESDLNGGYSYGNNIGIRHLRALGLPHVVIATSDTEILTPSLFQAIRSALGPDVGVIGPEIIAPCGRQNPVKEHLSIKYMLDLLWMQNGMPGLNLRRRLARLKPKRRSQRVNGGRTPHRTASRKVYMLHGSFLCLTDNYLSGVGLFDERIFMFCEEDLIAWQCAVHGLDQVLLNDVSVRHADDTSTNLVWGDSASNFKDREQLKSTTVLKSDISNLELLRIWRRNVFERGQARFGDRREQ